MICAASMLVFSCNNEKTAESKNDAKESASKTDEPWVVVEDSTMWRKFGEYGTPGPMHTLLASWNGTWTGEISMRHFEGDSVKKSMGTGVNRMVMNGRYQESKHSGDMMGMPFEGVQITGYDNFTKEFVSTWYDNMSTGIMTMKGNWDEGSKTLTYSGTYPDILRPGRECTMRQVLKVIDENTHQFEMYGPDQKTGKEFKMMEMTLKRK